MYKLVAVDPEVPGAAQGRLRGSRAAHPRRVVARAAHAGHGRHPAGVEVHLADLVVEVVGHVEQLAPQGHPLGIVELGRGEVAVGVAGTAGADGLQERAVKPRDDDPVVAAVGH